MNAPPTFTCYVTLTPGDGNPIVGWMERARAEQPDGINFQRHVVLIPFVVRCTAPAGQQPGSSEMFERILTSRVRAAVRESISEVYTRLRREGEGSDKASDWLTVVQGAIPSSDNNRIFAKVVYGPVVEEVFQHLSSTMGRWNGMAGYSVSAQRSPLDAIVIGTARGPGHMVTMGRNLQENPPDISGFRWDLGCCINKKHHWKEPWGNLVAEAVS